MTNPNPKQAIAAEFCLQMFAPELATGFFVLPN